MPSDGSRCFEQSARRLSMESRSPEQAREMVAWCKPTMWPSAVALVCNLLIKASNAWDRCVVIMHKLHKITERVK